MHIMASATTLTKASESAANVRQIATNMALVSFMKNIVIRAANYKMPINIRYDFLLVPKIGTLSLISPYMIFTLQGM